MVTLSILLVSVMSDSEQVLILTQFVALIVTAIQLAEIICKSQLAAVYYTVSILNGLLQTAVGLAERRISLGVCDSGNLGCGQRVVTPYQIGTCQKCLCGLL